MTILRLRDILATASLLLAGSVAVYEFRWLERSKLALPMLAMAVAIALAAVAILVSGGPSETKGD